MDEDLSAEEIFNRAACVFNSLDEVTKAMVLSSDDRDKRHGIEYVDDMIDDLYPNLNEDNFRGIFIAVYNSILWGPYYLGNRIAS